MRLTETQRQAVERAVHWYFLESDEQQVLTIGGYAGVGKSTIVTTIVNILALPQYAVLYCAPTGKAVSVLRRKGATLANTLHRTFYHVYKKEGGKVSFKTKAALPSVIKLIVIDEVSMVNDAMMDDILKVASCPIILLGDPGQLPPIFGGNRFIGAPDIMLTEVLRQNDASGILTLATMARQGEPITFGKYGDSKVVLGKDIDPIEKYDTVLCWKNSTRMELNKIIRGKLGLTHTFPVRGEKLITLNNSYEHELVYEGISSFIVNGLGCIGTSDAYNFDDDRRTFSLHFKPDFIQESNAFFFNAKCNQDIFMNYASRIVEDEEEERDDDLIDIDFGYALTVHKSQGSEWGRVLIIDDYAGNKNDYKKWLYTAVTRGRYSITMTNP